MEFAGRIHNKSRGKRVCGGLRSKHSKGQVSGKDLNSAELDTVKVSESPMTVVTANGEVLTKEEATVYVKQLDLLVTVKLLEDTPAVLSLGKLCEDHGYNYHWTSGQRPHLFNNGRKIECNTANYVPFVVPGLSTSSSSSSSPTSPASSSQDAVRLTEHPASTRSESMSEEVRGNSSRGAPETENPNKNDDNEEVRGDSSHGLPEWQEFKVDESVPEHRDASSSSHELPIELTWYRVRKASLLTSRMTEIAIFAREPRLRGLLAEDALVQSCPERKFFGDLKTADHNVLGEGCESRHTHRHAVVVQDLTTQWIQSYRCKTKTSQETQKSLQKVMEPT